MLTTLNSMIVHSSDEVYLRFWTNLLGFTFSLRCLHVHVSY